GCKLTGQRPVPSGMSSVCGSFTGIVKTKKKGKKPGHCTVSVMVSSSDHPKKMDKDKLVFTCNPQTAATCPSPTTTTTTIPCDCCSNSMLKFTTSAPSIG